MKVPVPVEVIKKEYIEVPVEVKVPEYITKIEKEPPAPVPVIVKTIHDTQVVTEEPTDIHHIELKPEPVVASAPPPVRATVTPPPPEKTGFNPWWLLLLLCCLPLCFLPCLCCKNPRKYMPGSLTKPARTTTLGKKDLIVKDEPVKETVPKQRATVKRVEEP